MSKVKPSSHLSRSPLDRLMRRLGSWYGASTSSFRKHKNTLGPWVNNRYLRYCQRCRQQSSIATGASQIREVGSVLVPGVMPTTEAERLSDCMSKVIEATGGPTLGSSNQPMARKVERPITDLGGEVLQIFADKTLDQQICDYFGCYYRIQWVNCYRSYPTEEVSASWLWHSDNVPVETLKVMLHLTDAGPQQGATQFMTFADTQAYYEAGYRGHGTKRRADLREFAKQHQLPYRPFCHDARAGDVMLFMNNALHKAVPPVSGYRDVLTYLLLPNPVPWDRQLEQDDRVALESNPGGYPSNPAQPAA